MHGVHGISSRVQPFLNPSNYDLVCKRASGYFITSETATFAGLLGAAVGAAGFGTTATSHSGLCSVSTVTDNEYLLFYWYYSYNVFCRVVPVVNTGIAINNMNNQGTIVVTGGTAPYKVTVTVFN